MKLKNTLGVVIGSLLATSTMGAFAQGEGSTEVEFFRKHFFTDSSRDLEEDGTLYGVGASYFLTDDVSLGVSVARYHDLNAEYPDAQGHRKNIRGELVSVDALYHFGEPGIGLRPYVSAGMAHQSIGQADRSGRDSSTIANLGAGAKYYFTKHSFVRGGLEGNYNIDDDYTELMVGVGIGMNFGGSYPRPVAEPEPEPMPVAAPEPEPMPAIVRVELDVKFDFDKAKIREESYGEIRDLANFMQEYPQTTTVVEGHTDSVGPDQYNQRLSERRAAAVKTALVESYGVESHRVDSVGYGETRPIADNRTREGRQLNRRVEAEVEAQAIPASY